MKLNKIFGHNNTVASGNLNIILSKLINLLSTIEKGKTGSLIDLFNYEKDETNHFSTETIAKLKSLAKQVNALSAELNNLKDKSSSTEVFMELYTNSASETFYEDFLKLLSKQLKAWQSILFLTEGDLLVAQTGYAFDVQSQRVRSGEGLVGQCLKERKTICIQHADERFFEVQSGLGKSANVYTLILPVLCGQDIVGVIELSCFQQMTEAQIEFAENVCRFLGSVISNRISSERNQELVNEAQEKTIALLKQEEQLRQNIEEMEHKKIIIDQQGLLMKMIVDNIPFPVFVKDEDGKYTLINKAEAELLGTAEENIIGKNDYTFVQNESEWNIIQQSDQRVLNSDYPIELKEQEFTTPEGKTYLFKTTKVPFVNNITGKKNILGVSIDLATFNYKKKNKEAHQATN